MDSNNKNRVVLLKTIILVILVTWGNHLIFFEVSGENPLLIDDLLKGKVGELENIYVNQNQQKKFDFQLNQISQNIWEEEYPLAKSMIFEGSGHTFINDMLIDKMGYIFLTGYTHSEDFFTINAYNNSFGGKTDGFVMKLSPGGHSILFSTYLGGSEDDAILDMELDDVGNIYLVGSTSSKDFPMVNAYNDTFGGVRDGLLVKLSKDGQTMLFSSFLGGSYEDDIYRLIIEKKGNMYLVGNTNSPNFPTINTYNKTYNGAYLFDGFLAKLTGNGKTLEFSTLLGGSDDDYFIDLAIDESGYLYVGGYTFSQDFPTVNSFNRTHGGEYDGFLMKLSNDGKKIIFSTFFGGSNGEAVRNIYVDVMGNVYLSGYTYSKNFPIANAYSSKLNGFGDGFLIKLSSDGQSLIFSTLIGGNGDDDIIDMQIDASRNIYLSGSTSSQNFPTKNAFDNTFNGNLDSFITVLSPDGQEILFSTFLGGENQDGSRVLALDSSSNLLLGGFTRSEDFPKTDSNFTPNEDIWAGFIGLIIFDLESDGMSNLWESQNGLDPTVDDVQEDLDQDGMPNLWEYQMGLLANKNDAQEDLDQDGMPNLWEYQMGLLANTNDGQEDKDGDWVTNRAEYFAKTDATNFWNFPLLYSEFPFIISAPIVFLVIFISSSLVGGIIVICYFINLKKRSLTLKMGAPDYETALKMKKGGFFDIESYQKAQDQQITTYEEFLFMEELHSELNSDHDETK